MSDSEDGTFFHLGHAVMDVFRNYPDSICQIDAATGASETNASVRARSTKLATSLTALGLVPGDILALGGVNHLDLRIPYYAALFNGLTMVGVDPLFKYGEIKSVFKLTSPKIAFCDPKDYDDFTQAARELGLDTKVYKFGDGPNSMNALIEKSSDFNDNDFKFPVFNPEKIYIWLISTSGSTGTVKFAAFTYAAWIACSTKYVDTLKQISKGVYKLALNSSPVQWISSIVNAVFMPLQQQTIVQTSAPLTVEHLIDIINKYRPVRAMIGPTIVTKILHHEKYCDLTCFDSIVMGGSQMSDRLIKQLKTRVRKDATALQMHGQTETMGPVLVPMPDTPISSCGKPIPLYQVQLVDPDTERVITEPNVPGEMRVKGILFSGYYNNPEETAKAFSKDGWFKTGDLMYKDERDNYYYVSRIKMIIKYQNYHVVPGELEDLIRLHPGVADVIVIGIRHPVDGEHPIACVVKKPGAAVTAQEIKDLVAEKLSEKKQLRGGVVFLDQFPLTSTGKVSMVELKKLIQNLPRE